MPPTFSGPNKSNIQMDDLTSLSDFELIKEAKNGNFSAFNSLIYKHDKKVLSIAAHYVNNAEDAKDIYQEVFIRVYQGLSKFKMNSEFTTWLFRITTNVCLTFCKRNRYRGRTSSFFSENDRDDQDTKINNHGMINVSLQRTTNREISDRVSNALKLLSPRQKMIFMMKHYEGYKLKEIATFLKCTEGTVKKQLFIAIRRLRGELKDLHMEGALE